MAERITQDQLTKAIWAAYKKFRGHDVGQDKDYILVMLFLKYISDQRGESAESKRFEIPEGASFFDLHKKRHEANLGELFNIALKKIAEANPTKLEGVFRNIDFNSEVNLGRMKDRNRRLKNLLEDFTEPELDLRPHRVAGDIVGKCYIDLISRFELNAGKRWGRRYTPASISNLLAKLAGAQPGDTICDPVCGHGSLLLRVAEESGSDDVTLYGQEVNGVIWLLARMNMLLHSKDTARIEWCDTLKDPALVEGNQLMTFDVVVGNPPFSLARWGADKAENDPYNRFRRGIPPNSKADYGFITHMLETAKPQSGRVAVIVPHGVLFRGSTEGKIRQALVEENLLDAVIGLPTNLFPESNVRLAILIFDRSREKGGENENRKDVLFIDASKEFTPNRAQNVMDEKHVNRVFEVYKNRTETEKYSHLAKLEEIKKNDFILHIPLYVGTFEPEEVDADTIQEEINNIEDELKKVRTRIKKRLKEIKIDA